MRNKLDISKMKWMNKPQFYIVNNHEVLIESLPNTNMWNMEYFEGKVLNACSFVFDVYGTFTFELKVEFSYKNYQDQSGILIYLDDQNWIKVFIGYIDEHYSLLSCVVTQNNHSDFSASHIASGIKYMYYRVSQRNGQYKVENSFDGIQYKIMRLFPMVNNKDHIKVGIYAASPLESTFEARFSKMYISDRASI